MLTSFIAQVLPAAETPYGDSAEAVQQLKQLNDQTIIVSHVWLDTEWDQLKHGAEKVTWTLGAVWGWRVSDQQEAGIRLKVPFIYDRSGASTGREVIGGIGDVEVGAGTAFRLSKKWRTGGGIELHTDTASKPALGDSVWRLHASWTVAYDVTKWLTLAPTVDYSHSIAEKNGVAPQSYLELSLPATLILPHDWSIGTNYKAKIDFENGNRWFQTVDVGVAKRLPNVPVVLSTNLEKPLNGGAKKFQVNFTMTYYFGK
ncbi:hypothetical protein AYO41_01790 [Verrucomicrobia bacterium SCGC AG-212-E04]|nr:hypothetical protein AYO41_01790 [Verrucomicrobia bacterium SCGC AG-212-E04]